MAGCYEISKSDIGRYSFVRKAANSQVIGTSQMYASEASRTTGIVSVKANGPSTDIREV